ncbi:hypothetical protein [Acinetobacter haemolyticus]|uniref:hypothetical protein n=1 Tax=Acinetobacter haemolyticus TaxID=29430 RepID=UPI000DE9FD7C|nr:hypothetical protein [Acinetobacter haemolyticus]WHR58877.1 hypothetical protein PGW89_05430 [Acinetobacter haemolyticus]
MIMDKQDQQDIILCIPGVWQNHQALLHALLTHDTGYIYAGVIIKALTSDYFAEIEEHKNDPSVSQVFRQQSMDRFSEQELQQIEQHQMVVYVICKAGSIALAQQALLLGQALLKAGGLAIKVETSGVTHLRSDWLNFDAENPLDLYKAFVLPVFDQDLIYSCGMHQFGKPEGCVNLKVEHALSVLNQFLLYLFIENPILLEKQTFSVKEGAEILKLHRKESSDFFDKDSLYFNPWGVWSLTPTFSLKKLFKFS